jgi:hypothetical protein
LGSDLPAMDEVILLLLHHACWQLAEETNRMVSHLDKSFALFRSGEQCRGVRL